MSAPNIPIPFAIGETLWAATGRTVESRLPCPDCAGARVVTLTLADGSMFSVECGACAWGCEVHGYVTRSRTEFSPREFIPQRVEVRGSEVRYSESGPDANCYSSCDADQLFRDRTECEAACAKLAEERSRHDDAMHIANLTRNRNKLAWSLHYWRGLAANLKRDLARIESRFSEIKAEKAEPRP